MLNTIILSSTTVFVEAASFDGTYNYHYTLNGPNGREDHNVPSGFIVSNGKITSNPPALSGTVDANGNVRFTGPSPYGSPSATFTGKIGSNGIGDGNYRDPQGLGGSWDVVRVSGGSGGFSFDSIGSMAYGIMMTILNTIYGFSFIGEAVGLSNPAAAIVGTTVAILTGVAMINLLSGIISGRKKRFITKKYYDPNRQGEYTASPPDEPPRTQGAPATTIGMDPTPIYSQSGVHNEGRALPGRFDVKADWGNESVKLLWDTPLFDPTKYMLDRYEIIWQTYDGTRTSFISGEPINISPERTSWGSSFKQTYRWNTQGDIDGIRVNAVFRDLNPNLPERFVRISDTVYHPIRG